MKIKLNHLDEAGILFGVGLASHCMGENPELCKEIATNFGLAQSVVEGVFTLSSHVLAHGIYESLTVADKNSNNEANHDLERALNEAYEETFSKIEEEIKDEYKLEESLKHKLFRLILKKKNKEHEDLTELRESFLNPILETLTSGETIRGMLEKNSQLTPDDFLKKIIEQAVPDFYNKDSSSIVEFVNEVAARFKKYFRLYFIQKLKENDKAKTVYFTHLLEGIVINTASIDKNLSLLLDFTMQLKLDLVDILNGIEKEGNQLNKIAASINILRKETTVIIESIRDEVKELSAPVLDMRDRKKFIKENNIFDFKYQYLDFVGRTNEMSRLWEFIGKKDDETKFAWWMITGPGGMGKSRIAQTLCIMAEGYYAGFFDFKSEAGLNPRWEIWKPKLATLIVIDYALSKVDKVTELIKTLARNAEKFIYPVRLLLLEREETEEWKLKLRPGSEVEDTLYRENGKRGPNSMGLMPLEEDYRWKIIKQVFEEENEAQWPDILEQKSSILDKLDELDEQHRPLFTFLMAIALAKGDNIRNWNTNELLENTLIRFESLWWKYIDDKNIQYKASLVLLVNTFCKQLNNRQLDKLLRDLGVGMYFGEFRNIYSIIANYKEEDGESWEGLQPDILGEFFILKTLEKIWDENPNEGKNIIENLLEKSWHLDSESTCQSALRIWSDFQRAENKLMDLFEILYNQIIASENKQAKNDLANAFNGKSLEYFNLNQYLEAIAAVNYGIDLDPEEALLYNTKGAVELRLNNFNNALNDYDKAIEIDRGIYSFYSNRAFVKNKLKRYKEAIDDYNISIGLNQKNESIYFSRAVVKDNMGDVKGGILDLDKTININPKFILAYKGRGLSYRKLGQYSNAIKDYDTIFELKPIPNDIRSNIYERERKGLFFLESSNINEVIKLDIQDYSDVYLNRGICKFELRKFNEAVLDFNNALELVPESEDVLFSRINAFLELRQFDKALLDVDKIIQVVDNPAEAFQIKGSIHLLMHNKKLACQSFKTAMELGDKQAKKDYNQYCNIQPVKSSKKYRRNDYVSVRYLTGEEKNDVKYKSVEEDINTGKCYITQA